MTGKFDGKVAIVTGGSSGMGRAAAIKFAERGARVLIASRGAYDGNDTVTEIREAGGEAIYVQTDVSQEAEVEVMVSRAVEIYEGLDYAFNNAGVAGTGAGTTLLDAEEEDWDNVMGVNLKGVWLCMKYEIPEMLKRGGGAIVNTSAEAGLQGLLNFSFVASKHGVIGLTKSAALGYGNQGIRVNAVCPGMMRHSSMEPFLDNPELKAIVQDMGPAGRLGNPEEAADAAVWLCSDDASFVNGVSLPVDGGLTAGRLPRRT